MKQKILTVVCVLFGLMMVNAGLNKFFNYLPVPEDMPAELMELMGAFMQITWLMPLVATVEIVGGILIAIPKFRALGAIVILPVMVGIVLHHIVFSPTDIILPLIFFAINIWAIAENWKKYLPMFQNNSQVEK